MWKQVKCLFLFHVELFEKAKQTALISSVWGSSLVCCCLWTLSYLSLIFTECLKSPSWSEDVMNLCVSVSSLCRFHCWGSRKTVVWNHKTWLSTCNWNLRLSGFCRVWMFPLNIIQPVRMIFRIISQRKLYFNNVFIKLCHVLTLQEVLKMSQVNQLLGLNNRLFKEKISICFLFVFKFWNKNKNITFYSHPHIDLSNIELFDLCMRPITSSFLVFN